MPGTFYGAGIGLRYQCLGNEEHLFNCTYTQYRRCLYDGTSVNCTVAECTEGAVRLVEGMSETEGQVEICLFGYWSKVCDSTKSQTYKEAQVVCKQLGYPYSGMLIIVQFSLC